MKKMTSRERMLTALDGGVPDRLPASVHDWMRYWLEKYLDGAEKTAAFERFGLDWSLYMSKWEDERSGEWEHTRQDLERSGKTRVEEEVIVTPDKKFRQVRKWDEYHSPWVTEYVFKEPEDVFIYYRYRPVERYDLGYEREVFGKLGDRGIARGVRTGPWQRLSEMYGVEKMIYGCFEDPEWVKDAMEAVTGFEMRCIETMAGAKIDLMETGGGHNSSTVISPDLFREFILPYEKRILGLFRELGLRTVYHTCGGMMPILELLVETGATALETLTPGSMGGDVDLAEVKRRVGGKVALIGGFDQYNGFEVGSVEDTREQVRHCFETAGVGGGVYHESERSFFRRGVGEFRSVRGRGG